MAKSGRYIYCFIKETENVILGSSTITDSISPVYTLPYEGISAVISDSEVSEYEPTRKKVLAHQHVITKVMEKYTIIPVAFGTVSNSKEEIKNILKNNYKLFNEQLGYFADKIELGLRVIWDNNFFNEDIEDDNIIELKEKVAGRNEDDVLMDKIELGRLVEASMLGKKEHYSSNIFEPLSKLAVESKLKDGIPMKTIFNAYFLVDKAKNEEFDKLVDALSKPYENKLIFSYTGPWPPYNFVSKEIDMSGAES